MHHYLLLLGVVAVTINGQRTVDAPVSITKPVDLDKPQNLVVHPGHGLISLTCGAQNADTIAWKFSANKTGPFIKPLPSSWTQEPATLVQTEITIVLQEKDGSDRKLLNGYYQCVAENTHGYKAITPPIRILTLSIISPSLPVRTSKVHLGTEGRGLRLPCYSGSGSLQISPTDYFDLLSSNGSFSWYTSIDGVNHVPITSDDRIKTNHKTGDLFFKVLKPDDQARKYHCKLHLDGGDVVVGNHDLTVSAAQTPDNVALLYPETAAERSVTCREGVTCYLPCLYGGRVNGQPPAIGTLTPPGKDVKADIIPTGSSLPNPSSDADGRWTCSLDSTSLPVFISVTVLTYPAITPVSMASQVVTTGSEVIFDCLHVTSAPVTTQFYKNENEVNVGTSGKSIVFKSVQRNDSSSISCVMTNDAGTTFKAANLIVYDKPIIQAHPVSGHSVPENVTLEEYTFNCSVTLDLKAQKPDIYWKTSVTGLANNKITSPMTDSGVTKVDTRSTPITLQIKYDSTTKETFRNSTWWCECTFGIGVGGGNVQPVTVISNKMNFDILAPWKADSVKDPPFKEWWVIGVVIAVIFFILIIILMIYCVKQNTGEQYFVDEKERKAGHDPELELEQKGFHDYHRPNQPEYQVQNR